MKRTALFIALITAATTVSADSWIYNGSLDDGGKPANGHYDLRLTLLDASGSRALTQPITLFNVSVHNGNFSTDVDFGVDLANAPVMKLKTEVAQLGSAFAALGEPVRFDPKATLAGMCWDTTGNIVAAGEFIGSTNGLPLEIKAGNRRAARFEAIGTNNESTVVLGSPVNFATTRGATISGGGSNASTCGSTGTQACTNLTDEPFTTIGGGAGNSIVAPWGVIGGGGGNGVGGGYGTVGGGISNSASGDYSVTGGGAGNIANGDWSNVAGGQGNETLGLLASVGGGSNNFASASESTVVGGAFNYATGDNSSVLGGESGTASGAYSVVAGGSANCAGGRSSFAAGRNAKVRPGANSGGIGEGCFDVAASGTADGDAGTFIWADTQATPFTSTGANQFLVRAGGGVMLNTNVSDSFTDLWVGARAGGDADADLVLLSRTNKQSRLYLSDANGSLNIHVNNLTAGTARLSVTGTGGTATLSNGGTWTNASSRTYKESFTPVDARAVLAKLAAMPITTWNYKQSGEGIHMGPMAEDFKATFGLAGDGKSIATVDADGVALAAIQGLNQKLEAENAQLRLRLDAIEARLK